MKGVSMASTNPRLDTAPVHPVEDKVKLLLGIKGYEDLRFKYCSDGRMLQNGYWQTIDWDDIMYVQENCDIRFTIVNWEDEDTGFLTGYRMHYTS
jgi:hypothetical protein|tara:strand:+ start:736 stop:1020 length:285 start_codon:yes stop_codon:yes gene_type:complete